jgi:hypothetical protein
MSFKFAMAGIVLLGVSVAGSSGAVALSSISSVPLYVIGGPNSTNGGPINFSQPSAFTFSGTSKGSSLENKTSMDAQITNGKDYGFKKFGSTSSFAPPVTRISFAYSYDFTVGKFFDGKKASNFDVTVSGSQLELPGFTGNQPDVYLKDLSQPGRAVTQTLTALPNGYLTLAGIIPAHSADLYALILLIPTAVAGVNQTFTVAGSVPLPGSLMMFGAFILGLVGLSYGTKGRQGW